MRKRRLLIIPLLPILAIIYLIGFAAYVVGEPKATKKKKTAKQILKNKTTDYLEILMPEYEKQQIPEKKPNRPKS